MKKKGVIALVLTAVIGCGAVYAAYTYAGNSQNPVEVQLVGTLNAASMAYDYGSDTTMYGTIVTRSSQTVSLNTEATLSKVYVSEGDQVEKGDKLLEYDMTLTSLQREMEDLSERLLEINLAQQQEDLATLKSGRVPEDDTSDSSLLDGSGSDSASYDSMDYSDDEGDVLTGAADTLESDSASSDGSLIDDSGDGSSGGSDVLTQDGSSSSGELSTEEDSTAQTEKLQEGGQLETDADTSSGGSLIEDSGQSTVEEGENTGTFTEEGQVTPDEETENNFELDTDLDAAFYETIADFVSRARSITRQDSQDVSADELTKILSDWAEISVTFGTERVVTDPLGTSHVLTAYRLNDQVLELLDSGTLTQTNIDDLYRAFGIALRANVFYWYYQVVPYGTDASELTKEALEEASSSLIQFYDAYYKYQEYISTMTQAAGNGEDDANALGTRETLRVSYEGASDISDTGTDFQNDILPVMTVLEDTIRERSTETEEVTEASDWYDDSGVEDDTGVTAEELAELIKDKESEIEETQLQIREAKLEIKKYDRELEQQTVTAAVDGVVTKAGTLESGDTDSFIVVSSDAGYYVKGDIGEEDLGTIEVGDEVTGTSYDTGITFTARITDISIYPDDNSSGMWYYSDSSSNTSQSQYSFYALIENSDEMTEGDCEYQFSKNTSTSGIYLPNYMIRTDSAGRTYCFARGEDGLLEKVYVKTGAELYSEYTEIRSGLTEEDLIAFPYGRGVEEGAKTVEVESLSATGDSSDYY